MLIGNRSAAACIWTRVATHGIIFNAARWGQHGCYSLSKSSMLHGDEVSMTADPSSMSKATSTLLPELPADELIMHIDNSF